MADCPIFRAIRLGNLGEQSFLATRHIRSCLWILFGWPAGLVFANPIFSLYSPVFGHDARSASAIPLGATVAAFCVLSTQLSHRHRVGEIISVVAATGLFLGSIGHLFWWGGGLFIAPFGY